MIDLAAAKPQFMGVAHLATDLETAEKVRYREGSVIRLWL